MKNVIFSVLLLIFFLFYAPFVLATDLDISCDNNGCSPFSNNTLFPDSNQWNPGMWKSKVVTIKNLDDKNELVIDTTASLLSISNADCRFDKKLMLSITLLNPNAESQLIWSGSLYDLINASNGVILKTLSPKTAYDFKYIVSLNQDTGNECQGKSTTFSLQLGFTGKTIPNPEANEKKETPIITPPSCTDIAPLTAPKLISATPGIDNITLHWSEPKENITFYYVSYGTDKNHTEFSNPNVGGKNTTSYSITGLDKNERYYFTLRAGNGCSLGPPSNEISAIPLTGNATTPIVTQNILGASTSTDKTVKKTNSFKQIKNTRFFLPYNAQDMIIPGIIVLFFSLIILLRRRSKKSNNKRA